MNRRSFLYITGLASLTPLVMPLTRLNKYLSELPDTEKQPILFVGHGNPMNAISENTITEAWFETGSQLKEKPKAILCISAHWETNGTYVTAMEKPRTIHDFYGFPQALFDVEYPAPGAPEMAKSINDIITTTQIHEDLDWGLDHGTWSVLVKMFPKADIPVFQLSIDRTQPAQYHYDLAKELRILREKGVLIIGSGNIVHNLGMAQLTDNPKPYDWALEFDQKAKDLIEAGSHSELINYQNLGRAAQLSIPTPEHYLPLLYTLGIKEEQECVTFFNEEMAFASGSMRSLIIE